MPVSAVRYFSKKSGLHFFVLTLCAGFCGLAGCGSSDAKMGSEPPAPPKKADSVIVIQKEKLSSVLRMPGELIPFQQVDLYAKVNSFVKKLSVDVGSEVKQGQLLAAMEAPEISSQLSGAASRLQSVEATYAGSKANYTRLLETSKTPGTISPNELDLAYARERSDLAMLQAAKAAYKEIADTKNYLEIRAPFSGIITARNVSEGAYVGPSGKGSELPLFTLQEQKKLRLVVDVPELYSAYLKNRNQIHFTVKSLPSEVFDANIQRMAGSLNYKLRSQRIEMDVSNVHQRLLPGMVAEISILMTGQESTWVVPESALIQSAEGMFVIRADAGRAQWVSVKKGRTESGKSEIFGKLQTGDSIILHASEEIRNGAALN